LETKELLLIGIVVLISGFLCDRLRQHQQKAISAFTAVAHKLYFLAVTTSVVADVIMQHAARPATNPGGWGRTNVTGRVVESI